jgi:4-methylaminobutanoate oxidase (formaldehyde-forming)
MNGTIRSRVVVYAAGAWTRQVTEAAGIHVPIVPTRHQLFVTEPLEGAHPDLPIVRVMDAAVYVRPCNGGLLWGVFEEDPRQFDMDALGAAFQIQTRRSIVTCSGMPPTTFRTTRFCARRRSASTGAGCRR